MKKVLFTLSLIICSYVAATAQINENFQSWTSRGGYSTFTQAGSGGTWSAVSTIVAPTGAANGTGSTGYCQLQSANGILTLPNIVSGGVGTISIDARVSGSNGGFSIQKNVNGGGWTNVQTYTSSSTTATTFSATVNDGSANIQLRINNTGGSGGRALYIYDVVTTAASFPPPVVSSSTTTGTVGTAFSYDLSTLATNSPTSFSITAGSLPPGLSLTTSTGDITGTPTTAGSYSITFTATNSGGTSSPAAILGITIAKGNQTITFNTLSAVQYGTAPGTLTATSSSGLAVSFSSSNTSVASVSGTTITYGAVGSANITATQAGNANWNAATSVVRAQVVTTRTVTITGLTANDKPYDGTTAATATGTPALSGVLVADAANVTLAGSPTYTFNNATTGLNKPVTGSGFSLTGSAAGNYTLTQPSLLADITALTLTLTGATANDKVYNGSTAATISGGTLNGVLPADAGNVLATTGTFASANVANNIAVTVLLTGTAAGNYTLTQPGLTADITKASQTITFGALADKTTASAPFALTATASSGLTVSYTSSNPLVATVSGSTVTITGAGTTIITASQAGNANYLAATSVQQTQLVTSAPVTMATYQFTGSPGSLAPSGTIANVTFSNISTNTINQNSNVSNVFTGNPSSGTWGTAFSATRYIQFTITPGSGFTLNAYYLDMDVFRSSAGATSYAIRSDVDNFASNLATGSVSTSQTAISTITLPAGFTGLTDVTFRIYGWGGNSTGDFRIDNISVDGNLSSTCTTPTLLAFQTQPVTSNQGNTIPIAVKATCANGITATGLNSGSVTINTNNTGCGLQQNGVSVSSVTANFVNGVATFSNVSFSRSVQTGVIFTTTNTLGLTNINSNAFNINAPTGTTPTNTTLVNETFESGTIWAYTIGTPSYSGSGGGGTDVTGIKTFSSNKSLCKSYSTNNASDERKSTTTVTFANQSIPSNYEYTTFSFQLASLGNSSSGAGVDSGDDLKMEISLNNGSSWSTLLNYYGNNDFLFNYSTSPVTALAYNANAQYNNTSKSSFTVQLPNGTTQFMFRITATNNRTNENWAIDNVKLVGTDIPSGAPSPLPTATGGTIATCPNTNNTLTVLTENTVGTVDYEWTPTTNMVPSTGDISNPVVNPSTGTVYTVVVTDADGCKATATQTITVPTGTAGLWTGNENNDWFQCLNWGNGIVPTATTNVTVPNAVNNPVIDPQSTFAIPFSGIAYSNDFSINTGGEVMGVYGSNLSVSGNWVNNGIFNPGDGTVNFTGTGTSTINGSTTQQFNNLTIDKPVQLLVDASTGGLGALAVNQQLDLNGHVFTVYNPVNTAITRTSPGFVLTETQNGAARLLWQIDDYSTTDNYVFPLGNAAGAYLPVTFKLNSGFIGLAGVSAFNSPAAGAWPTGTEEVLDVANPGNAVQRFWHLESDQLPQAYNADVTFTYPASEEPANGVGTDVKFQRYNKPTDTWDAPLVTQTYSPGATSSVLVQGITKFSWWGGGNENTNPLPVGLVDFNAGCNDNEVVLNWTTASETNNDYFTIQRSRDLVTFEDVAIVQGSGNSNTLKYYAAKDNSPLNGTAYYRLVQTDYDGGFEIFSPVNVSCAETGVVDMVVYPNPASTQVMVNLLTALDDKGTITIYNQYGQLVASQAVQVVKGTNTYTYDISNLAAGQYFVQILLQAQGLPVQKLVVAK